MSAEVRFIALLSSIVLPFSALVWWLLAGMGLSPVPLWISYGRAVLVSWLLVLPPVALVYLVRLARDQRPRHPLVAVVKAVLGQFETRHLLPRLAILVLLPLLLGSFTSFKSVITQLQPFVYDEWFMQMDRMLFFGRDPWNATHALFGDPFSTWVLQQFYIYWFALMWMSLAFVTLRTDLLRLRAQYLLAFALSFIVIGCVSALLLSSAGPCYYAWAVDGPDVYAPLMERLREIDGLLRGMDPPLSLNGLVLQDYLQKALEDGQIVFGGGISAMPSMHVSVAALISCAAWQYRRWLGALLMPVVIVIWIGSIHLAWHYALDGLVALVLAAAIWRFSAWAVARAGIPDPSVAHAGVAELAGDKRAYQT